MKSDMTKKRLAATMKQLISEKPFVSISVSDICDVCGIHRKTFYYHFKDKYDLVAWIYDTELSRYMAENLESRFEGNVLLATLEYLRENKAFYSRRMEITGQNSFMEHFRKDLYAYAEKVMVETLTDEKLSVYQIAFVSDGIANAVAYWLKEKSNLSTGNFIKELTRCYRIIYKMYDKLS